MPPDDVARAAEVADLARRSPSALLRALAASVGGGLALLTAGLTVVGLACIVVAVGLLAGGAAALLMLGLALVYVARELDAEPPE